jgi:hypothetical protein
MLLPEEELSAQPLLADASLELGQLFGLVGDKSGTATKAWRRSFRSRFPRRSTAPEATLALEPCGLLDTYKVPRMQGQIDRTDLDARSDPALESFGPWRSNSGTPSDSDRAFGRRPPYRRPAMSAGSGASPVTLPPSGCGTVIRAACSAWRGSTNSAASSGVRPSSQ